METCSFLDTFNELELDTGTKKREVCCKCK